MNIINIFTSVIKIIKDNMYNKMRVIKRSGTYEDVSFDKILNRFRSLSNNNEFEHKLNIDETIPTPPVMNNNDN